MAGLVRPGHEYNTPVTERRYMRQNGIVKRTGDDGRALVALMGADGCAACSSKGGCGIFCSSGGPKEAWVANEAGASQGDRVEIELSPRACLALSGAMFIVPVIVLVVSLALLPPGADSVRTAIHALAGLVLGIASGVLLSRAMSKKRDFDLKIVSIIGPERPK